MLYVSPIVFSIHFQQRSSIRTTYITWTEQASTADLVFSTKAYSKKKARTHLSEIFLIKHKNI